MATTFYNSVVKNFTKCLISSCTGGCYIQEIVSGPAKACGKLKSGDQIVIVDSVDISDYEHMDAVDILRNTSKIVRITVKRKLKKQETGDLGSSCEIVTLTRNGRGRVGVVLGEDNKEIIIDEIVPGEPAAK